MQEWFHFKKVGIKSVWITTVPSPFYRVASKILKRAVQIQLLQHFRDHLDNSSQLSHFQCAGLRKIILPRTRFHISRTVLGEA